MSRWPTTARPRSRQRRRTPLRRGGARTRAVDGQAARAARSSRSPRRTAACSRETWSPASTSPISRPRRWTGSRCAPADVGRRHARSPAESLARRSRRMIGHRPEATVGDGRGGADRHGRADPRPAPTRRPRSRTARSGRASSGSSRRRPSGQPHASGREDVARGRGPGQRRQRLGRAGARAARERGLRARRSCIPRPRVVVLLRPATS